MAEVGRIVTLFYIIAVSLVGGEAKEAQYFGKSLGKLSQLHHGVSGEVFAVDGRTLYIKDFTYDGQGPAAYFYASTQKAADKNGFRLKDESGNGQVIRKYRKEGITLTLPEGKTLNNIKIFYVWCEEFDVNFGDVKIARNLDIPRPQKIDSLNGVHGISSDSIVIVDAQTLLIPNLSYDGEAPDAKFWVGRGLKPTPNGIRVPDENGKQVPLRRYDKKTVVLTLPGDLTVFDIGHFGIWCEQFTVDFGHVLIPQPLNVPPSLKMLGVSPQSKLNCEVLNDDLAFEVRWAVAGESIVLQLVAKLDNKEYMSFGISNDPLRSVMIGGDVVVAWVDKETLKGYAEDYYLDDKSQCSGPTGSCPDTRLGSNTNSVRLLNAAMVNGYSIVTYQRPVKASDEFDQPIYTNRSQSIIWAIGPLNQRNEVSFHSRYLKRDSLLDFGRTAKWNCPVPENEQPSMVSVQSTRVQPTEKATDEESLPPPSTPRGKERRRRPQQQIRNEDSEQSANKPTQQRRKVGQRTENGARSVPPPTLVENKDAWTIPAIQCYEPEDGVLYAQMGPTGGKRGYPAITGHVGWGISWYINGLLIPEINVVRGKTYTFVVEGGLDPEVSAKYHPFYITDDPIGGFHYKTEEEQKKIQNFAGVRKRKDGSYTPTGTGRLCHWTQTGDKDADDFESFGAYQRKLELKCDKGEPGVIQWTPDKNTPDTVYYQCYTHRYLGWKINVLDSCDEVAASEVQQSIVQAPNVLTEQSDTDLEHSPSLRIETMVKLNTLHTGDKEESSNFEKPKYVEVSPLQASTERGPKMQTALSASILDTTSILVYANAGFRPGSVKMESSFKPLVSKDFQDKMDQLDYEPNVQYESEKGIINRFKSNFKNDGLLPLESFDYVFVPSLTDKPNKKKRNSLFHETTYGIKSRPFRNNIIKHPRNVEEFDEPIARAAEKVESYYLPPANQNSRPLEVIRNPSNIDIEAPELASNVNLDSPPDIVVTYDGKRVSGQSLTAKLSDRSSILDQRASKATEYIKARPQFGQFRGDLPPLNQDYINRHAPQLQAKTSVLGRDLDTPLLPPSSSHNGPASFMSTRLSRVKSNR